MSTPYDALCSDVQNKYPYFTVRGLSSSAWASIVADNKTAADAATTREEFIAAATPALAQLRDVHVYWTSVGGAYVAPTYREFLTFSPLAAVQEPNAQMPINFATTWFQSFTASLRGLTSSTNIYQGSPFFVTGTIMSGMHGLSCGHGREVPRLLPLMITTAFATPTTPQANTRLRTWSSTLLR